MHKTDRQSFDFAFALRPDKTGFGLGLPACGDVLRWLRMECHPPMFRVTLPAWDVRAQRVYCRLGFQPITACGDFLVMGLDDRPWQEATLPLRNGIPVYPGDPPFERRLFLHKEDCGFDASMIAMSAHTGTHADAPAHVGLRGGIETLDPDALNGTAQLFDWETADPRAIHSRRVILKHVRNGLTPEEAQSLVDMGVETLVIDRASVGFASLEKEVHSLLLQSGVVIVENAALEAFSPGWYQMRCLPLLLPGSDGSPVRLLLREEWP
jgi:arylformamidase